MTQGRSLNALFLGSLFAGHRTRFLNLEAHTKDQPGINATYRGVSGWKHGATLEGLPFLPAGLKGRLRATIEGSAFARLPRPDVIWTSAGTSIWPFVWSQLGPLRRPVILDLDCTFEQLEDFASFYFGRKPREGLARALPRSLERMVWQTVSLFTPWSEWAAGGLREGGIPNERIVVLPPGVDLEAWSPAPSAPLGDRPVKLLFVGGNFERKGGQMLLKVFRTHFAGRCELSLVTQDQVEPTPGVTVHRAEPNSPLLHSLYASADVFVLPTQADCFGIAAVEAMASGLPVIMSKVGAAEEIVSQGQTGWLIEPNEESLTDALEVALQSRQGLAGMGLEGRRVAEERFDGRRNDLKILELMMTQHRLAVT